MVIKCLLSLVYFGSIDGIFVTFSPSGSTIAGETYSLTCSATLRANRNPPSPETYIMPLSEFEWFFGPNGNDPLPFGLTPTATVLGTDETYRSTLEFSPLSQSHTGNYTCRLGAGRLVNSNTFTVTRKYITIVYLASDRFASTLS